MTDFDLIKQRLRDKRTEAAIVVLFGLALILFHIFITPGFRDDAWFAKALDGVSLGDYLSGRFETWTSRLFIEIPLVFFTKHLFLWRIANALFCLLLAWSFVRLLGADKISLVLVGLLLFPWFYMSETGWCTTFICYIWPFAAGLWSLTILKDLFDGRDILAVKQIAGAVVFIFAANMEQLAVLFFCILAFALVVSIQTKKKEACSYTIALFVIDLSMLAFSLLCPGNAARVAAESAAQMPEFQSFDLIDKAVLGLNSTFACIAHKDPVTVLFLLAILFAALRTKKKLSFILGAFATAYYLGIYALSAVVKPAFLYPDTGLSGQYVFFLLNVLYILMVLVSLFFLLYEKGVKESIFISLIFAAGVLTRVMLGFSPTCFESGQRTYTFMDFSMIYITIRLVSGSISYFTP